MYDLLLGAHIAGGAVALTGATGALAAAKGERAHVAWGRAFALGMLVVFLTAVPMTIVKPNLFMFLIAVFSFYLAFTGWLRARNRSGEPGVADWVAVAAMSVTAIVMFERAAALARAGEPMAVVLRTFGGIGGTLALGDVYSLWRRRYRGPARIADHLTRMLAGTIAAVTAFAVVNVRFEPPFVVWLAPTVVLTPVIVYWIARVRRRRGFEGG